MNRALALLACLSMSGCTYGGVFARHLSQPLSGFPVTAAHTSDGRAVEGFMNDLGIELGRCMGRVCIEQAISYDFSAGCDACQRGGPIRYTGKVSVRLFGSQK